MSWKLRLLLDILIVVSALAWPWWITAALGVIGFFLFPRFVEGIIVGFLLDVWYGVPIPTLLGFPYLFTASAVIIYVASGAAKRRMRFARNQL